MYDHPLEDAREQRLAVLGTRTPACRCGETDPFALNGAHPNITCYECEAIVSGRPRIELQHPAGRHNRPETVPLLGNDHRVWDAYKASWPERTFRNPEGSPLLRAAACVRCWLDLLLVIVHRTVGWVPTYLEQLDDWLGREMGPRWWDAMPTGTAGAA